MKIKIILTAFALMAATGLAAAATNDVATLVQRGLFEEEANHQLDAAIRNYREAIEQFDHDRPLAATAIFRLGECYRKQGKTNEANAQYERIVREFPDQSQLAQLSRGNLPATRGAAQSVIIAGEPSALPSDEAEFLRKVTESVQTSPDLVNQQLGEASAKGYVSAAQFLIAHGADVNTEYKGMPAIIEATRNGNEAMVQLLLSNGGDVNARDSLGGAGGYTALSWAVHKGFMTICRTLVAHGADVNAKNDDGGTPLHVAAALGNLAASAFLITNKALIDPRNNGGETPLVSAIWGRNSEIVKLLLDNHADANMESSDHFSRRLRPLDWAIYLDSPDLVKLLLERHADPNALISSRPDSGENQPMRFGGGAESPRWDQSAQPVPGMTPLLWAAAGNPPHAADMIKLLLDHHADANVKTPSGSMPLYLAVEKGNLATAEILITNKAQIDARNDDGQTPLITAIAQVNGDMVKLLLDNHADANMEAVAEGRTHRLTPLVWAIYFERPEILKLLLEHQADPNAVRSSASISAESPSNVPLLPGFVEMPLMRPGGGGGGPPPRWNAFPPVAGETPLMSAVTKTHRAELAELLLDHGAKPNLADPDGWTALIYAIGTQNTGAVRTLIEHGADVNILDKEGRPPLAHLGTSDTGRQIQALLIKAGADADYNRRGGIWTCGPGGTPKTELFQCPTNSINHYTLLEFLATLYEADAIDNPGVGVPNAFYAHYDAVIPFPDFARVAIHRLDGQRAEVLHVNVAGIFKSGDGSKDVALQAGDLVEIPEQEHKVAEKWHGLSAADTTALNKCLWRTAHVVVQGKTNDIALVPSFANAAAAEGFLFERQLTVLDTRYDWLGEVLNGRKPDTIVRSFLLDKVVHDANVLVSTWDLSRVQLTRHGAKMTFDLTAKPPPEVWLENGDVIEIPELPEGLQATGAK